MTIEHGFYLLLFLGVLALVLRYLLMPKDRRQYEFYVAKKLAKEGFERIEVTRAVADGGYDIIAYKGKQRRVVSVKKYKKNVRVNEVREIQGVAYEKRAHPMVVTTNGYTETAKKFARSAGVVLLVMPV